VLYAGAAVLAVCRPSANLTHYRVFLFHPLTYLAVVLLPQDLSFVGQRRPRLPKMARAVIVAVALMIVGTYVVNGVRYARFAAGAIREISHPPRDSNRRIAAVIQSIRQSHPVRSLSIWGWAPGVYVVSGIPPSTRDIISHFAISDMPVRPCFRQRYLADLRSTMPDLFIDAVANGAFMLSWDEYTDGYESYGELRRLIDANYVLVDRLPLEPGAKPVRFFARRDGNSRP
jgi:hypothetical protein